MKYSNDTIGNQSRDFPVPPLATGTDRLSLKTEEEFVPLSTARLWRRWWGVYQLTVSNCHSFTSEGCWKYAPS
jgi:hypothetical protein